MKSYSDIKPEILMPLGNGAYHYHWGIKEVEAPSHHIGEEKAEPRTQWESNYVTVWAPLSANKITEAVINELWPVGYEQKLINEYYSVLLGIITGEEAEAKVEAYREFLTKRAEAKAQVDKDWEEYQAEHNQHYENSNPR